MLIGFWIKWTNYYRNWLDLYNYVHIGSSYFETKSDRLIKARRGPLHVAGMVPLVFNMKCRYNAAVDSYAGKD